MPYNTTKSCLRESRWPVSRYAKARIGGLQFSLSDAMWFFLTGVVSP